MRCCITTSSDSEFCKMEGYSSSSSSYFQDMNESRGGSKMLFQSSLRSVKKTPSKPWKKPAIAPLPPTRPRVYKVDPMNFRDLVQRLTGAPEYQSPRLRKVAPPPINVQMTSATTVTSQPAAPPLSPFSALYKDLMTTETTPQKMNMVSDWGLMSNSLGLSLSPSSRNWCSSSYPLLSPGTLSSLEQSTVL